MDGIDNVRSKSTTLSVRDWSENDKHLIFVHSFARELTIDALLPKFESKFREVFLVITNTGPASRAKLRYVGW